MWLTVNDTKDTQNQVGASSRPKRLTVGRDLLVHETAHGMVTCDNCKCDKPDTRTAPLTSFQSRQIVPEKKRRHTPASRRAGLVLYEQELPIQTRRLVSTLHVTQNHRPCSMHHRRNASITAPTATHVRCELPSEGEGCPVYCHLVMPLSHDTRHASKSLNHACREGQDIINNNATRNQCSPSLCSAAATAPQVFVPPRPHLLAPRLRHAR